MLRYAEASASLSLEPGVRRELAIGVDGRGAWSTICHASSIENVESILMLIKEEARVRTLDLDAKEVVEGAHVLESELAVDDGDDVSQQTHRRCCDHNVINVEEEVH